MTKWIAVIILALSCTSEGRARDALDAEGFTAVRTTGYSFRCAKDDDTCTGFEAIAPNGRHVSGVVGCGFDWGCGKGCTVRLD